MVHHKLQVGLISGDDSEFPLEDLEEGACVGMHRNDVLSALDFIWDLNSECVRAVNWSGGLRLKNFGSLSIVDLDLARQFERLFLKVMHKKSV